MPSSVTLIQTLTASGSNNVFDFTSIPNTYTDLMIISSTRTNNAGTGDGFNIAVNNSYSNLREAYYFNNNNNGAMNAGGGIGTEASISVNGDGNAAGTYALVYMYIPNYANTSYQKTWFSDNMQSVYASGTNTAYHFGKANSWNQTAAINRLTFTSTGTLTNQSKISIYGITGI